MNLIQTEGKSGEQEGHNNSEGGLLIFQNKPYTKSQIQYIHSQCNGPEDEEKLAKMVFGDKDTNKTRDQGTKPQWFSPQQAVMGDYDKSFTYGITIAFNSSSPNMDNFKILMDQEFKELESYLSNGGDVVIPKPKQQDINKNKNKYYKDGKRVIWHNIGMNKTTLPFDFMAYIQQKISELRKYARDTKLVDYYGNYKPSNDESCGGGRGRTGRTKGKDKGRAKKEKGKKKNKSKKKPKFAAVFNCNGELWQYYKNQGPEEWDDELFATIKAGLSKYFKIEDTFTISTKDSGVDIDDMDEFKEEFESLEDGNTTMNFILKDVTPLTSHEIEIDHNNQQLSFTLYGNSAKWNNQDFDKLKKEIAGKYNIQEFTITTKESDDDVNDISRIKNEFDAIQDGDTIHFVLKDIAEKSNKKPQFVAVFNHNDKKATHFFNQKEEWDDKLFTTIKANVSRYFGIEDTFAISTKDSGVDVDDMDEVKEEFESLEDGNTTINFILKDVIPLKSQKIIIDHNNQQCIFSLYGDSEKWNDQNFENLKKVISGKFKVGEFTITTKETDDDVNDISCIKNKFDSLEDGNPINVVLKDVTPSTSKKIIIHHNNHRCIFSLYGNSEKWNTHNFEKLKKVISGYFKIEQFTITAKVSDDDVNDINCIKNKFDSLQDGDTIQFVLKDVKAKSIAINQRVRGNGKNKGTGRGDDGRGSGEARSYDSKQWKRKEMDGPFDARAGRGGGRGTRHRAEKVNGQHQGLHPCLAQSGGCKFGPNCRFAKIPANACLTYLNHQIKPTFNPQCNFGNQCRFKHIDLYNNNTNLATHNTYRPRQTRRAPPKFPANETNSTRHQPTPYGPTPYKPILNKKFHPCVVQHGYCQFGDNCKFANIIGNACLRDLKHQVDPSKPECRFGRNCRDRHIKLRLTRQIPGGYRSTPRSTPGGTPGGTPGRHRSNINNGLLLYQTEWYTKEQLQHIHSGCVSREDMKKLGKMLFGDNDVDRTRGRGVKRQYNGGQAGVMGQYDRSFTFGIITTFYRGDKGVPEMKDFRNLMNSQFAELRDHLVNGFDVIIPKPTQQDIDKNKKRYYKDGQQVIFHNIGTGIASLPFEYIEYIQHKIDELRTNYARDTKTIKYYNYYKKERKADDVNIKVMHLLKQNENDKIRKEYEQKFEEKQREIDEFIAFVSNEEQELQRKIQQQHQHELNKLQQKHEQKFEEKQRELDALAYAKSKAQHELQRKLQQQHQHELNTMQQKHEQELKNKEENLEELKKRMSGIIVWKWKDNDGSWKAYDETISASIEQLKKGQSIRFKFRRNKQTYKITKLTSSTAQQENVKTHVKRDVKQTRKAGSNIVYPEWWHKDKLVTDDSDNTDEYGNPRLYSLDLNSSPAKDVVDQLKKTRPNYNIIKVESVENQMLYDAYWNARKQLIKLIGENNLNTRRVWHGTGHGGKDVMGFVQKEGFRKEFNKTAMYGQGTYFARDARYSCPSYCCCDDNGVYQVFQCEVIMGESHRGSSSYDLTTWPKKDGGKGLIYDSLVNDTSDPSIFVIHENVRAYPMFVIHYKR